MSTRVENPQPKFMPTRWSVVLRAGAGDGLPAGVRVLREAPTYWLCAVELDEASRAALERREAAADAVAVAEEDVRSKLSRVAGANAAPDAAWSRALPHVPPDVPGRHRRPGTSAADRAWSSPGSGYGTVSCG